MHPAHAAELARRLGELDRAQRDASVELAMHQTKSTSHGLGEVIKGLNNLGRGQSALGKILAAVGRRGR